MSMEVLVKKRVPEKLFCFVSVILAVFFAAMVSKETSRLVGLASFFFVVSLPLGWWWNDYKDEAKHGVYGVFFAGLVSLFYFNLWYLAVLIVVFVLFVSYRFSERRF